MSTTEAGEGGRAKGEIMSILKNINLPKSNITKERGQGN